MGLRKKIALTGLVFIFILGLWGHAEEKTKKEKSLPVKSVKAQYLSGLKGTGLNPEDLEVYSIGQSHIDAAWRWRWRQTAESKTKITFGMAIQNIETYPSFNFHQSAPQYYEWVEQYNPELFQKILEYEKQGRWIAVGGMWVEPDCNMPEGESFVRQFLYGQRYFLEKLGHTTDIAWLLDSFGYNWNLPQFAARSGCKYMWTSKLTWNAHNVFPFHLFHWQAPDGSRVLTHICPIVPFPEWFPFQELKPMLVKDYNLTPESGIGGIQIAGGFRETRLLLKPGAKLSANYLTTPQEIQAQLSNEIMPVVGAFYGLGDGGHGPLPSEIEKQLALQELGYGKIGTASQLFKAFEKYSDRIATWNDEMYLEYHEGVMTTHEWIKRANRGAEALMRKLEAIATTAYLFGADYPKASIIKNWKLILLNQFHDILPGSSLAEIYKDADEHYTQVNNDGNQMISNALSSLEKKLKIQAPGDGLKPVLVYNPLGWQRSDLVKVQINSGEQYKVFDQSGKELPSQIASVPAGFYNYLCDEKDGCGKIQNSYLYFSPGALPSLGWKVFYLKPGEACAMTGPNVNESKDKITVENAMVSFSVDKKTGLLVSLFDKRLNQEMLSQPSNKILAFKDQPKQYSAWNISENYERNPVPVPEVTSVKVDAQGPLFVRVLVERKSFPTSFKQWLTLSSDSPMLDIITYTDDHWKETLVKLEFNTVVETDKVVAEIPYAVIERSTHPKVSWDKARKEMPVEKWTDLSNKDFGIALINFGKYGFSLNPEGNGWRMSIIKTARYPTPSPEAKKVNVSAWFLPNPDTDQGEHWAHLALLPHRGDWRESKVYKTAYEYNTPVIVSFARAQNGDLPSEASLFSLESESAYIAQIKKAEDDDGIIVRIVEGEGKDTKAELKVNPMFKIVSAYETDLIELNPKPLKAGQSSLSLDVGHYEIRTIKLNLQAK